MSDPTVFLEEMANGFQDSAILLTACRCGVFAALGDRERRADELAAELELDRDALERVLLALTAAGVLCCAGDRFRLDPLYSPVLSPDGERTQASIFNHIHGMMKRWARLDEILATGLPVKTDENDRRAERDFILGMENVSRRSSQEVARRIDLSERKHLLDLGGGPATAALTFAREFSGMRCTVFDLPGPLEIAAEQVSAAGMGDRVSLMAGDFLADDIGSGYDAVYVSNIIHAFAEDDTALLFAKVFAALEPGGMVMVKDFYLENCRTRPARAARFSVNMLVGTDGGRCYTWDETEAMLAAVGFGDFRRLEVARVSGIISAFRPASA